MSPSTIVREMLPSILPLAAGWAVARWLGGVPGGLRPFIRYVLLPVLLFIVLLGAFDHPVTLKILLTGAVMGGVGVAALRWKPLAEKLTLDPAAALPALACFAIPVLGFTFGGKETAVRNAALLFVAVATVWVVADAPARSPGRLIREPWVWAFLAALLFDVTQLSSGQVVGFLTPLGNATAPLLLLFLGAALQGVKSADFMDKAAWVNIAARWVMGGAVAFLAIQLFHFTGPVKEALTVAALAPPTTAALAPIGDQEVGSRRIAAVGTLASVVAMVVLLAIEHR